MPPSEASDAIHSAFRGHVGAITKEIRAADKRGPAHCAGSIGYGTLAVVEELLGPHATRTAETGCGRSTILFSRLSAEHHVFCIDDRDADRSSVKYYADSPVSDPTNVRMTFGPTQETLLHFEHPGAYDAVLLDGPHGYPFPELEYFHFYPRIRSGGLLIIDDVQISTIGRMADVLQEDAMWDMEALSGKTAFFRRTSAESIPPDGDDWYRQGFNLRRTDIRRLRLVDGGRMPSFEERLRVQASVPGRLRRVVDRLTGRSSQASRRARNLMQVYYLEIVTKDVDAVCETYARLHGVTFGEGDATLGGARTAPLPDGGMLGIRAPMHETEEPVVRPYLLVDDIEAAVAAAAEDGAEIAHAPMELPGHGTFAIYVQGAIHHGLWQKPPR